MKQYFEVGFYYTYSERVRDARIVYGTKQEAKAYLDGLIKEQPQWLINQIVGPDDKFINPIKVEML